MREREKERNVKQVLQYFKNYKWKAILAPLFKMLEAAFELLVPLVMAAIIDNGIAGNDKPYIYKMAFVMVGLGVIGLGCSITAQYFSAKTAMGIGKEIRYDLFKHTRSTPMSCARACASAWPVMRHDTAARSAAHDL